MSVKGVCVCVCSSSSGTAWVCVCVCVPVAVALHECVNACVCVCVCVCVSLAPNENRWSHSIILPYLTLSSTSGRVNYSIPKTSCFFPLLSSPLLSSPLSLSLSFSLSLAERPLGSCCLLLLDQTRQWREVWSENKNVKLITCFPVFWTPRKKHCFVNQRFLGAIKRVSGPRIPKCRSDGSVGKLLNNRNKYIHKQILVLSIYSILLGYSYFQLRYVTAWYRNPKTPPTQRHTRNIISWNCLVVLCAELTRREAFTCSSSLCRSTLGPESAQRNKLNTALSRLVRLWHQRATADCTSRCSFLLQEDGRKKSSTSKLM